METPKEYYYTYYSYEEWGKGYFGSRGCKCLPEEDVRYFGSSKDKTFRPTEKIILKDDYNTREEAIADEIILQRHYKVVENSHFANRAYQTSTKFCYIASTEEASKNGKISGLKTYELGIGIFGRTEEKISSDARFAGKISGNKNKEQNKGICGMTKEERIKSGKLGGTKTYELGVGIHALTDEERKEIGRKSGLKTYELGIGIFSLTQEQKSEISRKNATQKWKCLETGYVSNPGGLSTYQKARGIDTSKRMRIE